MFRDSSVQSPTKSFDYSDVTKAIDERDQFRVPTNAMTLRPLSATVKQGALKDCDEGLPAIIEGLNRLVTTIEVIWHLGSTAVLGLNSTLVMKLVIRSIYSTYPLWTILSSMHRVFRSRTYMASFSSQIASAYSCSCRERLASRWIQGGNF